MVWGQFFGLDLMLNIMLDIMLDIMLNIVLDMGWTSAGHQLDISYVQLDIGWTAGRTYQLRHNLRGRRHLTSQGWGPSFL